MEALPLFYCDHHPLPLPERHRFPIAKYRMVRDLLFGDGRLQFLEAPLATTGDLLRVHTPNYVQSFLEATLDTAVLRRIGFPWSPGLVTRTLASTGGTLAATKCAVENGCSGSVAGGTHHAFRHEGAGYCVFNDLAISTEWALQCTGVERVAIIDLDVHQGDGTASIFEDNDKVFTFSVHGAHNFPFRKQCSTLDIALPDNATAAEYFPALESGLKKVQQFAPELILFQSGVDALCTDRLGRLALTDEDLAHRDQLVFAIAEAKRIPIVITMGGGYSEPIQLTAEAHAQTYRIAGQIFTQRAHVVSGSK